MSALRPDISVAVLNQRGQEYLPGYLGIEILSLAPGQLNSRMPIRKLHIAPMSFCTPPAWWRWLTPAAATPPSPTCRQARSRSPPLS